MTMSQLMDGSMAVMQYFSCFCWVFFCRYKYIVSHTVEVCHFSLFCERGEDNETTLLTYTGNIK